MRRTRHPTLSVLTLTLGLALAACGETSTKLTISARAASASAPAAGARALVLAGGRVAVDRVRMVIRDVKLEREGMGDEVEVGAGPFLLDLAGAALDGGVTEEFTVSVPTGTFDELRFVVHKLEDGRTIGDPDVDAARASIVLDLTVDGEAFRFTTDVNDEQRIAGTFAVDEGGSADNITIEIDPSGWFTAGDGSFLDPRVSGNRQAIEENLRTSIDAFEDDDRDGHDDAPGHG